MKLNAVHRKELHAQELLEFAEQEKVPVRFIEVMPVGAGKSYVGPSNEALKTELEQWYGHVRRTRKKKETVLRLMCGTKSCRCPSALSARSTESSAEAATAYG